MNRRGFIAALMALMAWWKTPARPRPWTYGALDRSTFPFWRAQVPAARQNPEAFMAAMRHMSELAKTSPGMRGVIRDISD